MIKIVQFHWIRWKKNFFTGLNSSLSGNDSLAGTSQGKNTISHYKQQNLPTETVAPIQYSVCNFCPLRLVFICNNSPISIHSKNIEFYNNKSSFTRICLFKFNCIDSSRCSLNRHVVSLSSILIDPIS